MKHLTCLILLMIVPDRSDRRFESWVEAGPARGPLRLHPNNPRYFTDGTKGSQGFAESRLPDRFASLEQPPGFGEAQETLAERFDYDDYLAWLARLNHNFIR